MESAKPSELIDIFRNLLRAIKTLNKLLLRETDALDTKSSTSLETIAGDKEQIIERINNLTHQQNEFLGKFNLSGHKEGLATYLEQATKNDPKLAKLRIYWSKVTVALEQCQQLNQQNGARIELLNRHTERSLDILRGQSHLPYTYGPTGEKQKERTNQSAISV